MKLGVQKPEKEFEKLLKHAVKGEARAQFLVGDRYHRGYGVEQDVAAAIRWYRQSASQEYPGALGMLGVCYDTGDGVEQNLKKKDLVKSLLAAFEGSARQIYRTKAESLSIAKIEWLAVVRGFFCPFYML